MCSNFCQEMDAYQGDLADIVRASGGFISTQNSPNNLISNNTTNHHTTTQTFDQLSTLFDSNSVNISQEDKTIGDEPLMQVITAGFSPATSNNNNNNNNNNNMKVGMGMGIGRGYGMMCNEMMIRNKNGSLGDDSDVAAVQIPSPRNQGIKRRKIQARKVVCIPAPAAANSRQTGEVVPSDLWAWRKYGQKPIKGSPYPRGYYRCSSSKGCSARKQVERSRTDPNMLVITYTSEHNHPWPTQRNALAGSTRSSSSNKPSSQKMIKHNPTSNNPLFNDPNSSKTSSNSPIKQEQRIAIHTDDNRASDPGLMTMTMSDDNRAGDTGLMTMTMTMTDDNRVSNNGLMTMTMPDDNRASDTGLMTMTMTDHNKAQDELIRINENDEELFNDSYRPLIMAESSTNQDFFADLGEFESDEDPLKMFNTNTFSGLFDDWSTNNNITINEDTIEKKM